MLDGDNKHIRTAQTDSGARTSGQAMLQTRSWYERSKLKLTGQQQAAFKVYNAISTAQTASVG